MRLQGNPTDAQSIDADDLSFCEEHEEFFGDVSDDDDSVGNESTRTLEAVHNDIMLMGVIRAMLVLTILTMAFIGSEAVFVYTIIQEQKQFQSAYDEVSVKLIDVVHENINQILWLTKTISQDIQHSVSPEAWPFVRLPDFNERTWAARELTHGSTITFSPIIKGVDRFAWETWAGSVDVSDPSDAKEVDDTFVQYQDTNRTIEDGIYRWENGSSTSDIDHDDLFPIWHMHPSSPNETAVLFDEASHQIRNIALHQVQKRQGSVMTGFLFDDQDDVARYEAPRATLYSPVVLSSIVGVVGLQFQWASLFRDVNELDVPVVAVVNSTCGGVYSFSVKDLTSQFLGTGDIHDLTVEDYVPSSSSDTVEFLRLFDNHGRENLDPSLTCAYVVSVFPTAAYRDHFFTFKPHYYRGMILGALALLITAFVVSEKLIGKSQKRVVNAAKQSDALVRSLFPGKVADRLYQEQKMRQEERERLKASGHFIETQKSRLKTMMGSNNLHPNLGSEQPGTPPIADLFPNTTVMFADISGFTSWASEREPSQVFQLLESIYRCMDKASKKFSVYKVETIGDCYVAATGLPEPCRDHVQKMCQFARVCLVRVNQLTKSLEAQLGPGTGELTLRIGINSGSVTAGVLRGERSRFQLFGDTMNVAARMESTGTKGRIQLSQSTVDILAANGKGGWAVPRDATVFAKGKGEMQTFWLKLGVNTGSSVSSDFSDDSSSAAMHKMLIPADLEVCWQGTHLGGVLGQTPINGDIQRLVDWNVDVLRGLLKAILTRRAVKPTESGNHISSTTEFKILGQSGLALDKVQMQIVMPEFDAAVVVNEATHVVEDLPLDVEVALRKYVACIATGYPRNPFHGFEHCSHVILSANKLLKRIMAADEVGSSQEGRLTSQVLYEHTFGISHDPVTHFAIVFSALVHDVGHPAVPNFQYAKEEPALAERYAGKSIAEQHSVDIAFELLMQPQFEALRDCIYDSVAECKRFHSVVMNSVLATDIFDPDLKKLREARWQMCFQKGSLRMLDKADMDRKATIVIEHIIQASDVAHTFQHWHIYKRWNARLFNEMYAAYQDGRSEKDPSVGWYNGELWFFDNYLTPLAHKLRDCGVFGYSSDEYLEYCQQNRSEWEQKGKQIVSEMLDSVHQDFDNHKKQMEVVEENDESQDSACSNEDPHNASYVTFERISKPG